MEKPILNTVEEYIEAKLTESIHTSARKSFRSCRRRYNYIFRNFWYPVVTPKPLEFGVAFHKAMETLYNPETWHDKETALALALVAFKKAVEEQRERYKKYQGVESLSPEEQQDYDERVELGLGMLKYYARRFLPQETLTPIAVEISFEIPIRNRAGEELWCKCKNCFERWMKTDYGQQAYQAFQAKEVGGFLFMIDHYSEVQWLAKYREVWKGLPVTYGGRIDALMKDMYGRVWIVDWKTAARIVEEGKDFFLELDDQITSYCYALWSLGYDIAGFLYVEIKKGFPKEPEPLLRTYKGRAYPTNKMLEHEYVSYRTIVEENDPYAFQQGFYDEYLEWLQAEGPVYHYRHQQHRSEEELAIVGDYIFDEAADMVDPRLRIYPMSGRWSCQTCAFQEPCMAENRGDDSHSLLNVTFEKRSYHYWEKTESSTDGKGGQ